MKKAGTYYGLLKEYKSSQKHKNRIIHSWLVILLITLFVIWELASRIDWFNPLQFSSPSQVYALIFGNVSSGLMLMHLRVSLLATITGFIIGTSSGILTASALWSSLRFFNIMNPFFIIMNALPVLALGPVIIVLVGPGYFAIITIAAILTALITSSVIYSGFKAVDYNYIKILKCFGATRGDIFKEAVFPATLPTVILTLKINIYVSWIGIIIGEFLVSKKGLGYLTIYGVQISDVTLVAASLLLITISAVIMHVIVKQTKHLLIRDSN
ncbi:ABC transporter permease [Virgibacillus ihumii]|uniref:ABC transporter permease n=1 Tax=Virgibacillus ihumii TaxID=2686091 RepID=UPI00157BCCF4|nr:ABC transporter permease [Virgibacillus ihumii]